MKFNKYFFDQDYSLKGILSWGILGFGLCFLGMFILGEKSISFMSDLVLFIGGFFLLSLGVYLVKTKKTLKPDERLILVQTKAYAYSWTVGMFLLAFLSFWLEEKNISMSIFNFSYMIIFIMWVVYSGIYCFFKNKI